MKLNRRKTVFASIMAGALLLAGCSAKSTNETAQTQAAATVSAGSENTITLSGDSASCSNARARMRSPAR